MAFENHREDLKVVLHSFLFLRLILILWCSLKEAVLFIACVLIDIFMDFIFQIP